MREFSPSSQKCVIFMGPDGAGKTTLMRLVQRGLAESGCDLKTYYFAPGFLKRYRPSPTGLVTTEPHALPPYGAFLTFLKILLMLFEFNLGVRRLRQVRRLVLFDRFIHDLLIDPRRYRMEKVRWWMRALLKLAPRPDLAVIVTAPPDVIQARKQEVTPEETARQVFAYQAAARLFPTAILVENEGDPEPLAARIIERIVNA